MESINALRPEQCEIERRIIKRDFPVISSMLERSLMTYSEDAFVRFVNCPYHEKIMLRHGNRSIGFLVAQVYTPLKFVLKYLVIDPCARRRGAGRILMNELIQIARDEDRRIITTEVSSSDTNAICFLTTMNFKALASLPCDFDDISQQVKLMKLVIQEA